MKLYVYRDRSPNFGDDLNAFLFPRLLPGRFDDDASTLFLGIGSILFDTHPADARKIVFGSGFGGYTAPPVLDGNWKVHFVRGPRTAIDLGLDPSLGIGDSAMLLATLGFERRPVKGRIGFMPHMDSACDGAWPEAASSAGLYYLDPRHSVDETLSRLLTCEKLVTEAMHGAIVADTLRIPWVAMTPHYPVHHAKWQDWADSLGIALRPRHLPTSNLLETLLLAADGSHEISRRLRWYMRKHTALGATVLRSRTVQALRHAADSDPQLSSDKALDRAVDRMSAELSLVR